MLLCIITDEFQGTRRVEDENNFDYSRVSSGGLHRLTWHETTNDRRLKSIRLNGDTDGGCNELRKPHTSRIRHRSTTMPAGDRISVGGHEAWDRFELQVAE